MISKLYNYLMLAMVAIAAIAGFYFWYKFSIRGLIVSKICQGYCQDQIVLECDVDDELHLKNVKCF